MIHFRVHILLLILALALSSCTHGKIYNIGVSQCSQDDWRMKMNDEINREVMFHEDARVEIRSADDSSEKQIEDIRYFVDNQFDIIIVAPNEAAALTPVIREVYERGIPVVVFDRNINGDSYTARIAVDNEGIGRAAARYALHMFGPRISAVEIYGLPGSTPADDRHNGFAEAFVSGGGDLRATGYGNWNEGDAIKVADSLLRLYPDVDLVYAHNDRMAIGAARVAADMGLDSIKIIGIDAAPAIGIRAVADSVIDATFLYPTDGHRLIQTALRILKGEDFPRETMIPASSAVDLTNADILLFQDQALAQETSKMRILKDRIDAYWEKHSSQTSLFYASIAIIILLFGVGFLILRAYWQRTRHQKELLAKNRLLQREKDKQTQLNEQLRDATNSKLMFFTNVSHDLRTPLTLIAEPVAQLSGAPNLTERQQTLVRIADKNVRILQRLINQILDFRKYENGKMEVKFEEVDFRQVVGDWMESFYAAARRRDITLTLDAPDTGEASHIAIDVEKIERVFFNILANALKYTPDNGKITVSYRFEANNLVLNISDTGEGISEHALGKIFERFYQADRIHAHGSGIGLALAKAFVELHGGTISVKSTVGKGSVFTVSLPVRHVAETAAPVSKAIDRETVQAELDSDDHETEFDPEKPIALIVDDNKDIRSLVTELLDSEYNIICAANGKEGIRKAVKYTPDLIICDVMMPEMDGLECCRRLKNEISTSHIPILLLTACTMDEQRAEGYESGADGYLAKPFNSLVLKARCQSLIENRKRIRQLWAATPAAPAKSDKDSSTGKAVTTGDIDNDFYNRFLDIFNREMGNSAITVDIIASRMGLERSQFYRKIKALTNYAPVELMRRLRLKHGRKLLTTTDLSISEIAYQTGFSTPAYFTKCYRDAFGRTPSEERNGLQA